MLSLFSTSSEIAGFRLQYMEVYNWGTFHDKIFKINPQGNNSLLTGANASGKSTFIDALLTLLVPIKKDRFYNQSSGVEKKGDRTEETYVCGHYGNIQNEGDLSTTTQTLRDKSSYSVLLATFANTDQRIITIFQVRWFSNAELRRAFGVAHIPLEIERDFSQFDNKGNWKKKLDIKYNSNANKKKIEFLESASKYAERISHLFGMRSIKALSLFNQVVGVKVLEDLDEFIRTNMLEDHDAEIEFIQLKECFLTLMDAKTNIEKAKEQISQLTPINEIAIELSNIESGLKQLEKTKEIAVYWFAKRGVELSFVEIEKQKGQLAQLENDLINLNESETELKNQETDFTVQIKTDAVGNQIETIKTDIARLEKSRDTRKNTLEKYNKLAQKIKFQINPDEEVFNQARETVKSKNKECDNKRAVEDEKLRPLKNEKDDIKYQIESRIETIQSLQKNKNNISGREAEIREEILEYIGATKEEIPFIGELIKVREQDIEWEPSIEKVLHNFALRLIVPEKYYSKVNEYVNRTNLKGRITYHRYKGFTSLGSMRNANFDKNKIVNKIIFKTKNTYTDWLEDTITNQYNYSCVKDLAEFNLYEEKVITKEGLIKFGKGKHEKDDRPHLLRKENYVLGWDNKEKINFIRLEIKSFQDREKELLNLIKKTEQSISAIDELKVDYSDLFKLFQKYDDIDWQSYASQIQEKEDLKSKLEKASNKVKELQFHLSDVKKKLITNDALKVATIKEIANKENEITGIDAEYSNYSNVLKLLGAVDVESFEQTNHLLLNIEYNNFKEVQNNFNAGNSDKISKLDIQKRNKEDEVRIKITAFKQPTENITAKFKDWRSDVSSLPDSIHLELISEYQKFLKQLKTDNLPKFEKKFNDYLQETITNRVNDFRLFFDKWSDSIKENIRLLNDSLKEIDFRDKDFKTYIQLVAPNKISDEVKEFRRLLFSAIPNFKEMESTIDGKKNHFDNHIEPLINKLDKEDWRKKVMDVRSWFSYKAEEFYKETGQKFKTYENMGQLSGGEKAQLTYTILGSAIAYQFGLTKEGLQTNSFRFIAIDEAFKSQDEDKARYLITLCKQLHLQLLVVTPSDNIHIVERDISFVHFVERKDEKYSWLYDMPIEQFQEKRKQFINL